MTTKSSSVLVMLRMISASIGPSMIESKSFTDFCLSSSIIPALSPWRPFSFSSLSVVAWVRMSLQLSIDLEVTRLL
jgi:hypothetical protein